VSARVPFYQRKFAQAGAGFLESKGIRPAKDLALKKAFVGAEGRQSQTRDRPSSTLMWSVMASAARAIGAVTRLK